MDYMILDITLFVMILGLIFIYNGIFMTFLDKFNLNLRTFIKRQEGFFSIGFITLFGVEQIFLILWVYIYKDNPDILRLIVSFFSLVVLTTASLQKFLLDTKRRYEKEERDIAKRAKGALKRLSERNLELEKKN